MSVVGIDLGNLSTVVAVARRGGIDILVNEVSNRSTPSLIAFGPKQRYIGESAKTNEISNYKNTVGSLKRLVGRNYNDPDVLEVEQQYVGAPLVEVDGQVGVKVQYLGEEKTFTASQLLAGYLSKIKQTASAELKTAVSDVVITVPAWYTDIQRRGVLDAAEIAGLNTLRIINDTTAAALGYGIIKTDLPEDEPRRVAIVDVGHSDYSVSICEFKKGQLVVKATAYDRHFGGRDFDKVLVDHFAEEFKAKYKGQVDVKSNPKALVRLTSAVEKLKKVLSANSVAPLNVESIMNDVDVSGQLKREELEELMKPLLARSTAPIEKALSIAGLTKEDIDSVEVIGGCTRVPALKEAIQSYFGKPLSFTLNADEGVARGAAFACAILSPTTRVRDFQVHDVTAYPIKFTWDTAADIPDEETELEVFGQNNAVPSTKILTFYRKADFDIEASYSQPELLPGQVNPWIGKYSIKGVTPNAQDDFSMVKVKARLNLHGILNIEQAYVVEEKEVEEPIPQPEAKEGEEPMETDESAPKTRIVKKLIKTGDLQVVSSVQAADDSHMLAYKEQELAMTTEDKLVADTEDRKNALEEYIYDIRGKLEEEYAAFASDEEKENLRELLMKTEDWLYDEGYESTKAKYVAKMEDLMRVGGLIRQRYLDAQNEKKEKEMEKERKAREELARRAAGNKKPAQTAQSGEVGTGGRAPPPPPPAADDMNVD
ncbi:adenyl-nucleotide exchange factor sse1 [Saitoella coloradoensis]